MGGSSGKGGKGGAPESPDFYGIARMQGQQNQDLLNQQTYANRPDQYGPFGSTTWEYTPGETTGGGSGGSPGATVSPASMFGGDGSGLIDALSGAGSPGGGGSTDPGRWTQRTSLPPELQSALDNLMGQAAKGSALDPSQTRDQAIDSAYRMSTSRLDPWFAAERSAREAQLANEGFTRGDAGWNTAMDEFTRGQNDAYQQALYGAQSGAGNTAFAQALTANMQPYLQMAAIKGLTPSSSFTPAGMGSPADLLGAAMQQYGADLNSYNAGQAGKNSKMGAGATLGAAAL